ncbi:MAG: hypothetical protein K1X88_02995 [Nannocystaceae bacterium]|nr:hypothetical protein [Nannocystaceae bacterium]
MALPEIINFVHQALFRTPAPEGISETAVNELAAAFWETLRRSPLEAPTPYGSPGLAWLDSTELREWLDVNADQARYDLPLFVSVTIRPPIVTPSGVRAVRRGR